MNASICKCSLLIVGAVIGLANHTMAAEEQRVFRAGVYAADVTPTQLPVIVNGGMVEQVAEKVEDRLHSRCLVLDDGTNSLAIAIVDSCMMPRSLLDDAKRMAQQETGIPPERILIAATHTHSAPSVHGCLGSDPDTRYSAFLPGQIAKGIAQAHHQMVPARIGWSIGRDEKNVASRRWLMRPGAAPTNRFSGYQHLALKFGQMLLDGIIEFQLAIVN